MEERRKRGGKEGKVTSPMFPRLHVNDTEKGGPRAPPRNKMALYEQLSVPFQRFGSGSASMLPLRPHGGSNLVPSMSSSNGGHERSVFTQFCNSPSSSFLTEKLHSYSSTGIKQNTMMTNQERKSLKHSNYQSLNAPGPLSSTAKSSSFKPSNSSNFRHFSLKKVGDEIDLRVSTTRLGIAQHCSNSQPSKDQKFKQKKRSGLVDINSGSYVRNQTDENTSQTSKDPVDNSASIPLSGDRILADASPIHSSKVKHPESLKRAHSSLNQENRSSSMDIINGLQSTNSRSHQECVALRDELALADSILMKTARDRDKENAFKVRTNSCLRPSIGDNDSSPNQLENGVECHENRNGWSVQIREVDRHDDVSHTSMTTSISALGLSTDDVVGVIGEKQFWKARRAIINQQRVFSMQVFELHRLMKVQRFIAKSPQLLLEDNLYTGKPPLDVPQAKKLRSEYVLEPPPHLLRAEDCSQKPHPGAECADVNAVTNIQHPSVDNDTRTGLETERSNYGSYAGNAPPAPVSKKMKLSSWCFPPSGNQWLVSVMSPSEGLVYKPYTGPCPRSAGFMAPFYGSSGPMGLNPMGVDFLNTAYGLPASHQGGIGILLATPPLGQTYLPPFGMPVMNQSISGSAVEHMIPFAGAQSKDNHLSMVDINFMIPHQSSNNMSTQMSRAISCCPEKFQASKESEVQGSTASSPAERANGDALPLFPMEPTVQASDQNAETGEQQTRVIKVVPHNPRLATESAARIFQSIQEERKQYD